MTRSERVALLGVLALAALLRAVSLTSESLWLDEIATVQFVTSRSLIDVIAQTFRIDYHPFAYYALLDVWTIPFGTSDAACRALSALLGVATVGVAFALARVTTRRTSTSLLVALVTAVAPTAVWYSQECRMYALLMLTWPLCLFTLLRVLTNGFRVRDVAAFLCVYIVFAYAHGSAGFVGLPFLVGAALVAGGGFRRRRMRRVALSAVMLALYGPWIVRLLTLDPEGKALYRLGPDEARRLVEWLLLHDHPLTPVGLLGFWLVVAMAVAGLLVLRGNRPAERHMGVVAASILVPMSVVFVLSRFVPMYQVRNLSFLFVPVVLLICHGLVVLIVALGAGRQPGARAGAALLGAAVAAAGLFLFSETLRDLRLTPQKENWRGLARYVATQTTPGDVIGFYAGFTEPCYTFYRDRSDVAQAPGRRLVRVERGPFPVPADTLLSEMAQGTGRTWIVYSHVPDPGELEALVTAQGLSQVSSEDFHDVVIRSYD